MEQQIRELKQTQFELLANQRIIISVLWRLGQYLYNHTKNQNLKSHLKELGEELKKIREPRKR